MQNWLEFIKEETLLQTNACNMGECRDHIIFNQKPKGHPNLSNEVTEYFQVCAKDYYIILLLDKNKDK